MHKVFKLQFKLTPLSFNKHNNYLFYYEKNKCLRNLIDFLFK